VTRVLVCGGRDFADKVFLVRSLDLLHRLYGFSLVVQGGGTGADWMAKKWAEWRGVPGREFRADWSAGPAAGPIRNTKMLREGAPDLVVGFPGGRGTADMLAKARAAGVPVIEPVLRMNDAGRAAAA
jgi:hypothetical protein